MFLSIITDPIAKETLEALTTETDMEVQVNSSYDNLPEIDEQCYSHNCGGCGKTTCTIK